MKTMSRVQFVKQPKRGRSRSWEVEAFINMPMHGRFDMNDHRCNRSGAGTTCNLESRLQAAGRRYGFKVQTRHGLGQEFFSIKLPITAILRD